MGAKSTLRLQGAARRWRLKLRTGFYGSTRKGTLLCAVPWGLITLTSPVVAPAGTVVVMSDGETTVKVAGVALEVALVAPGRLFTRILTAAPTLPTAVVP